MHMPTPLFLWPEKRPEMKPFRWALDGGGRELITNLINHHGWKTMIEVGVYCGGSVLQWLEACHGLTVYGVDPYPADAGVGQYFRANADFYRPHIDFGGMTEDEFIEQMEAPDSLFPAVLSNLWEYQDRFIPVRGFSPQALVDLKAAGVEPDIIFLDAMKTGEEIPVALNLWPDCLITGDDWTWQDDDGRNPIRSAVLEFVSDGAFCVAARRATWILESNDRQIL